MADKGAQTMAQTTGLLKSFKMGFRKRLMLNFGRRYGQTKFVLNLVWRPYDEPSFDYLTSTLRCLIRKVPRYCKV